MHKDPLNSFQTILSTFHTIISRWCCMPIRIPEAMYRSGLQTQDSATGSVGASLAVTTMKFVSRSAGRSDSKSSALVHYGTLLLAMVVLGLSTLGAVDGAEAIYVFGDSYVDTGNIPNTMTPYGSTWPGKPAGRWSDGRNIADYFAELFGLPSPTPSLQLKNDSPPLQGVNFARSGSSITYGFGRAGLDTQVDDMEALVQKGVLAKAHLSKSVTVISIGLNDYDARNYFGAPFQESNASGVVHELNSTVATVVNGIAVNVVRLHGLGIRNIIVLNLPLMACTPLSTMELAYKACSTNSTFLNETAFHNSLLQQRVRVLNQQLRGLHVVIADQTKAFDQLFHHGPDYGFVNALTPCCHGKNSNLYAVACGSTDSEGKPIYTVCPDPSKAVLFDTIHPTQAAAKAVVIDLFASVPGYTLEGPMLKTWIRKYNV